MKKSLVIVVVIALLILGSLVILRSQPNPREVVEQAKFNAIQASLKAFVAFAMTDLEQYYSNSKNTTPYAGNVAHKQILDARLAELKGRYGGEYLYRVLDQKENTAVKASDAANNIYVCMDSLTIKVTDIAVSEFDKNTDCSGQMLK